MTRRGLPEVSMRDLAEELEGYCSRRLSDALVERLHVHYMELRTWNQRLSLISLGDGIAGASPVSALLQRHYGESLLALNLIEPGATWAMGEPPSEASFSAEARSGEPMWDLGSGGGFPGLVLAAACPRLQVSLFEARQKKWAFLSSATRKMGLRCECVNARVGDAITETEMQRATPSVGVHQPPDAAVQWVVSRAVHLTSQIWNGLLPHLSEVTRLLLWVGQEAPQLPSGYQETDRISIPQSDHRAIVKYERSNK